VYFDVEKNEKMFISQQHLEIELCSTSDKGVIDINSVNFDLEKNKKNWS
jgi:hypothetical protein